jgi:hypothetical protein
MRFMGKVVLVVFILVSTTPPAPSNPGVAAAMAADAGASLAAEVVKGIFEVIRGSEVAQVRAVARIDGPDFDDHPPNDRAFSADSDKVEWPEIYLTGDTGNIWGRNHGAPRAAQHMAWAKIQYCWTWDGGWGPCFSGHWSGGAFPWKDAKPSPEVPVEVTAAAVGVFSCSGTEVHQYTKSGARTVQQKRPTGSNAPDSNHSFIPAEANSVGGLYFSPKRFHFDIDPADSNQVTVAPAQGDHSVNLLHTYAQLPDSPQVLFPSGMGWDPVSDVEVIHSLYLQAPAAGLAVETDPNVRADLTITGAAIHLREGSVPRYKTVEGIQVEKDPFELLASYLADEQAVSITAPQHAQVGYVPELVFRQVIRMGERPTSNDIYPELMHVVLDPSMGPGASTDPDVIQRGTVEMVALIIGVKGRLEQAATLSASTPGTYLYTLVEGLQEGDEFPLPFRIVQQGSVAMTQRTSSLLTRSSAAFRSLILAGGLDEADENDLSMFDRESPGAIDVADAGAFARAAAEQQE